MILALLACDTPAVIYPVDPCRLGDDFAALHVEASCTGPDGELTWDEAFGGASRVGGVGVDGYDDLSFHVTGTGADGSTLSVGRRGGELGVYLRHGERSLIVGFLPSSEEAYASPYVSMTDGDRTCDTTGAGEIRVSGLPASWGGSWELAFSAGTGEATTLADWDPAWPEGCPLSPDAWSYVTASAACDGRVLASYRLETPHAYEVELDPLARPGDADATWLAASATCSEGETAADVSLTASEGEGRLYSTMLTLVETDGTWAVEDTRCGSCDTWDVAVSGLPEL